MHLVPASAEPYLVPARVDDRSAGAVALAPLRCEALSVLADGYRAPRRSVAGASAWVSAMLGGLLLARSAGEASAGDLGTAAALAGSGAVLLAVGAVVGHVVLRAGRTLSGAIAAWLRVPAPADTAPASLRRSVLRRACLGTAGFAAVVALVVVAGGVLADGVPAGDGVTGALALTLDPDAVALLIGLVLCALVTAVATAGVLGGARRVQEAAWERPLLVVPEPSQRPAVGRSDAWHDGPRRDSRPANELRRGDERDMRQQPQPGSIHDGASFRSAAVADPADEALFYGVPRRGDGAPPAAVARPAALGDHPSPPTEVMDLSSLQRGAGHAPAGASASTALALAGAPTALAPAVGDARALPAAARPAPVISAPSPQDRPTEVLLPDGRALTTGTSLLGRHPVARPGEAVDSLVVLADATVTKTHVHLRLAADTLWVTDRASTNGTILQRADGSLVRCRPWEATRVVAPAVLHLGAARLSVEARPAGAAAADPHAGPATSSGSSMGGGAPAGLGVAR
ncbi:FHA domain-containing protein [Georgenia sp. MJ206]|uniref:FHA domain-containing protein n=1 Tax=Georgenia wangjunii TaxID=3117730 RepID=UPI002F26C795